MAVVFAEPWLKVTTWRSTWPAAELRRRGFDAYVVGHHGPASDGIEATVTWADQDVVVVHVSNQDVGLSGLVRQLRRDGVRGLWLNYDDDYWSLGDVQDTRGFQRTAYGPERWWDSLMRDQVEAVRRVDGVICATEAIAERWRLHSGHVVVIRNWLPRWITELPIRRAEPPMAGWMGTMEAHGRDVSWLGAEAKRIRRLGVVGDWRRFEELTGRTLDWHRGVTIAPAKLYRYLGAFSVGIVPLVDDAFNRAKSWIKVLEMGAMGVPCVVSPVRPYEELAADHYTGMHFAGTPETMAQVADVWLQGGWSDPSGEVRAHIREWFTLEGRGGDEWEAWAESVIG